MATRKPTRYKITVWHGEGKSLFYVLRNGSVVKTFHKRADAESYISGRKTNPRKRSSHTRIHAATAIPAKLVPKKGGGFRVMVAAKYARRLNPKKFAGVPEKHMLKIARSTLKMSDVVARIMGGMTKERAREVIREYGGGDAEIRRLEK